MSDSSGKDKWTALHLKMRRSGIYEKDIKENFVRASGKGGQKVNKTSSCVYLKHVPSSIEVKCEDERSRALNRLRARERLLKKLKEQRKKEASKEKQEREKKRRQKRKRSKKVKEKMLEEKRRRSEIKELRKKIKPEEE